MPFLIFAQGLIKKPDTIKGGGMYLDISLGISIPMGSYARADVNNSNSGFATPGLLGQINFDWMGKGNTGLAIQYSYQNNPLKSSVKNDTLEGMSQALGTRPWTNHYLMAGFVFLRYIKNVYIEGRVLIGVVISSSPLFNTYDPLYLTPSSNIGTGFAYDAQFGAGYKISDRVAVKFKTEYILGTPKIHHQYGAQIIGIDPITGAFIYSAPTTFETQKTISALYVDAGLVIKLSK